MDFIDFNKVTESETFSEPKEDLHLEYKESGWKLPKNIWDTVSAFSNTDGGLIVLGVSEPKKHYYKIEGIDNVDDIVTQLFNDNNNSKVISRPVIQNSDWKITSYLGKQLLQIKIYPAQFSDKPVLVHEKAYIRTDDGDRLATQSQLKYMYTESQQNVDTRLLNNYDWDEDLELNSVEQYKDELKRVNDNEYKDIKNAQLLFDLGVLRKDRRTSKKSIKMTEGGLLFFGKFNSITDRFPRFQLDYTRFKNDGDTDWIDRVSAGDMNYSSLNIYSFYNIVLNKLINNINDKYEQDEELTRGSYYSDLKIAAKEALVNCLMHAYYDGNIAVKIEDRPSYWNFTNPGDMRVSQESFLRGQESEIRNPEIATLFRRIGISEKAASGGPRILRAASRNHLLEPEISIDSVKKITKLRIWKIDAMTQINADFKLNPTEKYIINYAIKWPEFKFQELLKSMNNKYGSLSKVRKEMNNLINNKIIISEGNGRSTTYHLEKTMEQKQVDKILRLKSMEDRL